MVGKKAWRTVLFGFFFSGNTRSMIYCINHSACGGEKTLYSPFLYDDPNLPPSPPVPADSNGGPKRKPCFQVFISSISTILYSEAEAGGFCLRLPLPSWCSIQRSRFGSTTVSTLVHGCEETTCYLLFADRYTERWGESRGMCVGPFIVDSYHQEAFC